MNSTDQNAQNHVALDNKLLNASLKTKKNRTEGDPSFGEKLEESMHADESVRKNEIHENEEPTYQSKFVTRMSAVAEKVEERTQSLRQLGLRKIANALNVLAERVTRLNDNLDLNAPLEKSALASSKKREQKRDPKSKQQKSVSKSEAANRGASMPVDKSSEQSPQAPAQSGAV